MKKVVCLLVAISLISMVSGCSIKKTKDLTDAEKFANEYSISEENSFLYATMDDVLELIEHKSGILFLGNSDCEWSTFGVKVLNQVLKENNVDEVYYFNPEGIKDKESQGYQKLLAALKFDDNSSLPIVYAFIDGKIIGQVDYPIHDDLDVSKKSEQQLEDMYSDLVSQYLEGCTSEL